MAKTYVIETVLQLDGGQVVKVPIDCAPTEEGAKQMASAQSGLLQSLPPAVIPLLRSIGIVGVGVNVLRIGADENKIAIASADALDKIKLPQNFPRSRS